jgi:hypothetical protein
MHPFATHLITALCGGLITALFISRFTEVRLNHAFEDGRKLERDAQALRDSARATKAAATRRLRQAVEDSGVESL